MAGVKNEGWPKLNGELTVLRLLVPEARRAVFVVLLDFPVVIGRRPTSDVVIAHPSVSDRHAKLAKGLLGRLILQDLDSSSGTFHESRRISKVKLSASGDSFFVGDVECRLFSCPDPRELVLCFQDNAPTGWVCVGDIQGRRGPYTVPELRQLAAAATIDAGTAVRYGHVEMVAGDIPGVSAGRAAAPAATAIAESAVIASDRGDEDLGIRQTPAPPRDGIVDPDGELLCYHCWWRFNYEDMVYIAEHPQLRGDPVLPGNDVRTRFLPTSFTPDGAAIDAGGQVCTRTACPRCHLYLPREAFGLEPTIVSIVGSPWSGKSYFLTSMIRQLRQQLPGLFHLDFADANRTLNKILLQYEQMLFNPAPNEEGHPLPRTQLAGELYDEVKLAGMTCSLPAPFLFRATPQEDRARQLLFIFFDNAGEHFKPGAVDVENPATRHLEHCAGLFFVFDPLQEPLVRQRLGGLGIELGELGAVEQQGILLAEAGARAKAGDGRGKRRRPLIFMVCKFDVWHQLLPDVHPDAALGRDSDTGEMGLDADALFNISFRTRQFLMETCPQMVFAAEEVSDDVVYLPVSAVGRGGRPVSGGITRPEGVIVPFLYLLWREGIIPEAVVGDDAAEVPVLAGTRAGRLLRVKLPDGQWLELPRNHAGYILRHPGTEQPFQVLGPAGDDAYLVYREGRWEVFPLWSPYTIGTAEDNDLGIDGDGIAPHHCRLYRRRHRWFVERLASKVSLAISGSPVTYRHHLAHGMVLEVGPQLRLYFRLGTAGAQDGASSSTADLGELINDL